MRLPPAVVVFDLDGVLIDSEPLMRFAFDTCYREHGLPGEPPIEAYLENMGESFPRIMDRLGLPRSLWPSYHALCRAHLDRVRLFPEAPGLLRRLRDDGRQTAILTGKDRVRTAETLDHFGLGSATDLVIASDDLEMPKPHPEGLRRILDHFGTDPEDAVMVGDSVNDILCAEEAGVGSIAVTWGTRPDRVRTLCHPDHVVDDWVSLDLLLFGETPPEARRAPRLEVSLTP